MKLFAQKMKALIAIGVSSFLLAGSFLVLKHLGVGKSQAPKNSAAQLLLQAGPAPWSRTEREIGSLQQSVRDNPKSSSSRTRLGQAYLQKARETSDPIYLTKAEALFKKALELDGQNFGAMAGLGSLCLSRHEFWEALGWAERGLALNPYSSELYGIIGDACVELGEYDRALKAIQKMVDLRPQLSSYSRVSYLRELHGDVDGAIEAMGMAVSSGGPSSENTSWCQVQLGNLYFSKGDYQNAERQYRSALTRLPEYVHAVAGLAKIKVSQDTLDEAIELYEKVVAAVPYPEYVIALGDLYEIVGKRVQAKQRYELVEAMQQLYNAN